MSKILIIDDDINALKLLGYTLRKAGFEVLVAQNGFEGLEKAQKYVPDLIVTDLMMPKMDGYEVTRRIRGNPAIKHLPVIMLTAKSQVHDKVAGFEAGVNDYVTKPVMPVELIARIKAHLVHPSTAVLAKPQGKLIVFLGTKGGTGVTTLAVNAAVALQQEEKKTVLADFDHMHGSVCQQLGLALNNNLLSLLKKSEADLNRNNIVRILLKHETGLLVLPPSHGVFARYTPTKPKQTKIILDTLVGLADYALVDLGTAVDSSAEAALKLAQQICVVTEPNLLGLDSAHRTIQYLRDVGLGAARLGVIVNNHSRTGHSFTKKQIEELLGTEVWQVIAPAPESMHTAVQSRTPLVLSQPEHVVSSQMKALTGILV